MKAHVPVLLVDDERALAKNSPATACVGKDRYATGPQALRRATYLSLRNGMHLNVYRCFYCENYHLTRSRGRP